MSIAKASSFLLSLFVAATAVSSDYQILPHSPSPDGNWALAVKPSAEQKRSAEVVFYDLMEKRTLGEDLSRKTIFATVALSLTPPNSGAANYEVAWAPDSKSVAIAAGHHQFADFEVFTMRERRAEAMPLPDLTSQWSEVDRQIAPFRRTKGWRVSPTWKTSTELQFLLKGSAFKDGGLREADFLDFAFQVTMRFDEAGKGHVIRLEPLTSR